jgi:hypothetical protein
MGLKNPVIAKGHPSGSGCDTSSLTLANDWLTPTYNVCRIVRKSGSGFPQITMRQLNE